MKLLLNDDHVVSRLYHKSLLVFQLKTHNRAEWKGGNGGVRGGDESWEWWLQYEWERKRGEGEREENVSG